MTKMKRCLLLIMCLIFVLPTQTSLMAKVPRTIEVGLETVYKDANQIIIKSDLGMDIGYIENGYIVREYYLDENELRIQRDTNTYYTDYIVYDTFEQASRNANGGIVAYFAPGAYIIYEEEQWLGEQVDSNNNRIIVSDQWGNPLFIAENNVKPIAFQGMSFEYNFPVTKVKDTNYRGAITVVNGEHSGLTPVNVIEVEEYLYGVVPAEMWASWEMEALKAQAVASRSIAVRQYNKMANRGYNVSDTVSVQAYKGLDHENSRTTQAVVETYGEVVMYGGEVAETLYSAASGGHTEDAVNVWGFNTPYLIGVPDPYEDASSLNWSRFITFEEVERCLQNAGQDIGEVLAVSIVERTYAGRVNELEIIGTNGTYTVRNESIRTFFSGSNEGSLRSRVFGFDGFVNTPPEGGGPNVPDLPEDKKEVAVIGADGSRMATLDELYIFDGSEMVRASDDTVILGSDDLLQQTARLDNEPSIVSNEFDTSVSTVYEDFWVHGEGYGHGVGMSQYGAKGMAEAGHTYEEILEYYYTGVTIEK